eukprot:scaffold18122_cov72-Skeletonema_dohrnii-CCMP3373.AAC.2
MAKAQLAFIEREFKDVDRWNLIALLQRIVVLDGGKEEDRIEGEEISSKMLSLIDEMEKNSNLLDVILPVTVNKEIGRFNSEVGTKQSLEKAKYYLEKARDIIKTSEDCEPWAVKSIEGNIAAVEARISGDSRPKKEESDLSSLRARYNYMLQLNGENDVGTMQVGTYLASKLFKAYHTIEASRLLDRLAIISRRVHGSDHKQTKLAESWWQTLQLRYAFIGSEQQRYQALRYEDDGDSCIVQGPVPKNEICEPRNDDNSQTFAVASAGFTLPLGTPVMLHGLKKAAHLNGEIGDVREYCKLSGRCVVHLEDKDLKPVKVKHDNLRIVFDLPDPKNLD